MATITRNIIFGKKYNIVNEIFKSIVLFLFCLKISL